jgi:hypothetical protein
MRAGDVVGVGVVHRATVGLVVALRDEEGQHAPDVGAAGDLQVGGGIARIGVAVQDVGPPERALGVGQGVEIVQANVQSYCLTPTWM